MLKQRSFPPNRAPKMQHRYQMFFELQLVSKIVHHPAIQTKIEQHFGGFFHQIKVRQPVERQDSMQTVIRDDIFEEKNCYIFCYIKYTSLLLAHIF
jgi:hypothetical protein